MATTTTTFNYSGAVQTFVVPPGVTSIFVDLAGAQGGDSSIPVGDFRLGARGGRVEFFLPVTPGEVLNVYVGGKGGGTIGGTAFADGPGGGAGWNGGGAGGNQGTANGQSTAGGGGGGGATDVRRGTALSGRVAVAGGGGGRAGVGWDGGVNQTWFFSNYVPGAGGGLTGGSETLFSSATPAGSGETLCTGGTQTAGGESGGARADGQAAENGSLGLGAAGSNFTRTGPTTLVAAYGTGGGGGGLYGGGGGGGENRRSGSGGSCLLLPGGTATTDYRVGFGIATFTYNRPPNAPTPTSPATNANLDRQTVIRLAATFSDPDPFDSPSASDWRYRPVGAAAWTTAYQSGPIQTYDIPAGLAAGNKEWQARFYDQQGLVSPYSASGFFTASDLPAGPTITAPVNNSTVSASSTNLVWSYPNQQAYQVRALDGADALLFDGGIVESSTTRSVVIDSIPNNVTRKLQVRIRDAGLWSAYSTVTVAVSYTPPAVPGVTLVASDATGSIALTITNPSPSAGQPTVIYSDLHRRVTAVGGDGIRIATALAGTFTDYTPASGVDLEYRVLAVAANGTTSTSAWFGGVFNLTNAYPTVYASTY